MVDDATLADGIATQQTLTLENQVAHGISQLTRHDTYTST